jgi:flagellin
LSIAIENFSASESRIRNVDVAKESAEMTKNQILQQAAATVLGQANQNPQMALKLLG